MLSTHLLLPPAAVGAVSVQSPDGRIEAVLELEDAGLVRSDEHGIRCREWHDGDFAAGRFLRVLEAAPQRQISISTHESEKATGLRRTYPHWISRVRAGGPLALHLTAGGGTAVRSTPGTER